MKTKKIPMRRCVGCRDMKEKRELIRIVRQQDGILSVDVTGRLNGRGAYICKNPACLAKAQKARALNREFSVEISDEIYANIESQMEEHGAK